MLLKERFGHLNRNSHSDALQVAIQMLTVFTNQNKSRKSNEKLDFMRAKTKSVVVSDFGFVVLLACIEFYPHQISYIELPWRLKEIKFMIKQLK